MTGYIVYGFFEYEKDLAAQIRAKPDVTACIECLESKLDVSPRQDIAGEMAHALGQIAQMVPVWVYGPYDIAHRIDQLARSRGYCRQGPRDRKAAIGLPAGYFTHYG